MKKVVEVKEYIKILNENNLIDKLYDVDDILNKKVEHFSYNSKDIKKNTLFICKGASFKKEYLEDSISKGAFLYISEKKYDVEYPCIIVKNIRNALAIVSKFYFNNPDEKLSIVGITGTKGKTTTLYYIKSIINDYLIQNEKNKMGYISTIDTYDGKREFESVLSTPEAYELYNDFSNMVDSNIQNVVMEASSQALKYNRIGNLMFEISVFLNIGEDHISDIEHPDFEDYFNSKLKIFEKSKSTCINLDDDYSDVMISNAKKYIKDEDIFTYSIKDESADIYGYDISKHGINTIFKVRTKKFDRKFELSMPGIFNVSNALAAIGIALRYNIPEENILRGLKNAKVPGRMEVYKSKDERILGIVDYAHNKLSFEKIFETVKKEYPERKIATVFGCPGSKAYSRRKDLGTVAGLNSDYIVITADDPAYENVNDISLQVLSYVKENNNNYKLVEDREDAIKEAIEYILKSNESYILLLLGKGNETRQKVNGKLEEYISDSVCLKKYIKEYEKGNM